MSRIKPILLTITVLAAAAIGLIQHFQLSKLREDNDSLRQQVGQLSSETERLTNGVPQNPNAAPNNQVSDLLRLRGEVAALRKQTNELSKLRAENGRMRASLANAQPNNQSTEAEPPPTEEQRESVSRMHDSRAYILAMLLHAGDNQGRLATNLDQVVPYYPRDQALSGTNQFDIVFQGSPQGLTNTAAIILLRERQPRQRSDGSWSRTYGFLDGHSEIHKAADGNFEVYEREHLFAPANPNPAGP